MTAGIGPFSPPTPRVRRIFLSRIFKLLTNRNAIFLAAIVFALFLPQGAAFTKPLILPALALVLTLTTMSVSNAIFLSPAGMILPALLGLVMSYLILGGSILALSALMVTDEALWQGFVLMAAVPPAIGIIPFSQILGGNDRYSLMGTVGSYLGGLIIFPALIFLFLGVTGITPYQLLIIMVQLVLLPLLLSRLLRMTRLRLPLERAKGTITNWSFFFVLYSSLGVNNANLWNSTAVLLPIIFIAVMTTFLLGGVIDYIAAGRGVPYDLRVSLKLLGTMKNYGIATGIALTFLSPESALPATLGTIFMILNVIWWDLRKKMPPQESAWELKPLTRDTGKD
jgi:BASS family bile acid:Na+ symporter